MPLCITGDMGDKFYIVLDGEVSMELPDPEIAPEEFDDRYKQYKLLLNQIEAGKVLA